MLPVFRASVVASQTAERLPARLHSPSPRTQQQAVQVTGGPRRLRKQRRLGSSPSEGGQGGFAFGGFDGTAGGGGDGSGGGLANVTGSTFLLTAVKHSHSPAASSFASNTARGGSGGNGIRVATVWRAGGKGVGGSSLGGAGNFGAAGAAKTVAMAATATAAVFSMPAPSPSSDYRQSHIKHGRWRIRRHRGIAAEGVGGDGANGSPAGGKGGNGFGGNGGSGGNSGNGAGGGINNLATGLLTINPRSGEEGIQTV